MNKLMALVLPGILTAVLTGTLQDYSAKRAGAVIEIADAQLQQSQPDVKLSIAQ